MSIQSISGGASAPAATPAPKPQVKSRSSFPPPAPTAKALPTTATLGNKINTKA